MWDVSLFVDFCIMENKIYDSSMSLTFGRNPATLR